MELNFDIEVESARATAQQNGARAEGVLRDAGTETIDGKPAVIRQRSWQVIRARDAVYRRLLAIGDAISLLLSLWIGIIVIGGADLRLGVLLALPGFVILAKVCGLYDRDESRLRKTTVEELPALFQIATLTALLAFFAQAGLSDSPMVQTEIVGIWAPLFAMLVTTRATARVIARTVTPAERCLLVADDATAAEFARNLDFLGTKAELVGVVSPSRIGRRADDPESMNGDRGFAQRLAPFIDELEPHRIVLATGDWTPDEILHATDDLKQSQIKFSIVPSISHIASMAFEIEQFAGFVMFGMRRFEISRSSRLVKRAFDIVTSTLALTIFSPLLLAIAIAIKLDSRGPMLFRQPRVGRYGHHFEILKFRSMVDGADGKKVEMFDLNESPDLFKIADDPRVTPVGRFLRRWSLDELPQLVNVLRGEMSLVGPRPLVINEDELIRGFYRSRLDLRPGITGHWQVLGSWRVPFHDMVTLDYLYVASWSLWSDIRLLWRTVPYVANRRGV